AAEINGDPYERLNRNLFTFNDGLDRYLMKPLSKGYDTITPGPVSRGITNFFNNLGEPRNVLNAALQGKLTQTASSTVRFLINTTLGIGGFFDVARYGGMKPHKEDFGQTLATWGMEGSSYVIIPVLGPSSVRDVIGELVDFFTYPLLYYNDRGVRNALYVLYLTDRRANLLIATEVLEEAAGEYRYEFVREAYWQNRKNVIYDGNPPLDLPYLLEDEPAGDESEVRP
ncbi:MAG: VacJ family lipoprotein, partial [Acidiferrobacterales bacterium]